MILDTDTFIYLSFALSFGSPMLFAAYQLRTLKGGRKGPDGGVERPEPTPPLLPGDDDLPPLPPELIPKLDDAPVRGPAAPRPKVPELV
mgnify:FL=1